MAEVSNGKLAGFLFGLCQLVPRSEVAGDQNKIVWFNDGATADEYARRLCST